MIYDISNPTNLKVNDEDVIKPTAENDQQTDLSPVKSVQSPLNKSLTLTGDKLSNIIPSGSEIGLYRAKALDLY